MTGDPRLVRLMTLAVLVLGVLDMQMASGQSPPSGPSPPSGRLFGQVVSDDGRLVVDVPVGSVPYRVHLSAVRVPTIGPAVAAYELRPLGTTFSEPVTASWQLDPADTPPAADGNLVWLGMARADDAVAGPWSWLDGPHVSMVDGDYEATGGLSRFGTLVVIRLPTLVRGPEAIWGPGYSPGRGIDVPLDLMLAGRDGAPGTAAFGGDWRFGGGYPDPIDVTITIVAADRLAAVWRCLRPGVTSLTTTFRVRQDVAYPAPTAPTLGLGPATAAFSVTFPVVCGRIHAQPNR